MNSTSSVLIPRLSEIQLQKDGGMNSKSKTKTTNESASMPTSEKLKGVEPDKQVNIKEFLNKNQTIKKGDDTNLSSARASLFDMEDSLVNQ